MYRPLKLIWQIASCIEESWTNAGAWIEVHIDFNAVRKLQLEITLEDIRTCIASSKLKIESKAINLYEKNWRVRIFIDLKDKAREQGDGLYERLKTLKRSIAGIQVKGLPQADRGVVAVNEEPEAVAKYGGQSYRLLVTGYGLSEVMGTDGKVPCSLFNVNKG